MWQKMLDLLVQQTLPKHVAIIMDGNGRYAQKQQKPRLYGHYCGAQAVKKIVRAARTKGIQYLTLYAFSTANWQRPQEEVDGLLALMVRTLHEYTEELLDNEVRVLTIGETGRLPVQVQHELAQLKTRSQYYDKLHLSLALSYGGRRDLVQATKQLAAQVKSGTLNIEEINEQTLQHALWTAHFPDPDLLIRTGGEQRISDFLLYESAYSEFYFTDVLWPDFNEQEFDKALADFAVRCRRFGKTQEQILKQAK